MHLITRTFGSSTLFRSQVYSSHKLLSLPIRVFSSKLPDTSYNKSFHRIISELSTEMGFKYITQRADTWVGRIDYMGKRMPLIGFDIGLNSSSAKAACDDKTCTSFLLSEVGVPNVSHELVNPDQWESYCEKHSWDVVCKPKNGTCGHDVFRVRNKEDLRQASLKIEQRHRDICFSPFYEIAKEYRLIMLSGKPQLVFIKEKPFVIGNGKESVANLSSLKYGTSSQEMFIPHDGERVELTWKHNLCNGAKAIVIDSFDADLGLKIEKLAHDAVEAIGAKFVSVDIIETVSGEFLVLEINNGVMTEYLISQHGEPIYQKVKGIFEHALLQLFFQKAFQKTFYE